jgi:pimeloyl-ACP methyl ester carboxylesterase
LGRIVEACALALGYRSRFIATRDARVRVLERAGKGDLPTVVVLHGLGSQGLDQLPLLQRLVPHVRRIVAPDFPGHGASEAPRDERDREAYLAALFDALDATLEEPAIVFGNSLGGFAAIRYAAERPARVRGLFLASPAGAPSTPDEFERMMGALRLETHADALRFLALVLHDEPKLLKHPLAWHLRRRFGTSPVRALVDSMREGQSLMPEHLRAVTAPVHLVWGRGERLLPEGHLEFFRAHLTTAHVEQPPGFGHSPQLDDVAETTAWVLAFARSVHASA